MWVKLVYADGRVIDHELREPPELVVGPDTLPEAINLGYNSPWFYYDLRRDAYIEGPAPVNHELGWVAIARAGADTLAWFLKSFYWRCRRFCLGRLRLLRIR